MTDDTTALVVEVLRAGADTRRRAATRGAVETEDARHHGGHDSARTAALRITRLLAQSVQLEDLATALETGTTTIGQALAPPGATVVGTALADAKAGDAISVRLVAGNAPAPVLEVAAEDPVPLPAGPTSRTGQLTLVPPPEETPAVTKPPPEPRTPAAAEVDAAAAQAEAVLDAAFSGSVDPDLGYTVLGERDRIPKDARATGPDAPSEVEEYVLPPGQGDDEDLSDLADVAGTGVLNPDEPQP